MNDTMKLLNDVKLHFNIEHPTFEDCYQYGYECAVAEVPESENPFSLGSREKEFWEEGWWAGFYGETSLFDEAEFEKKIKAKKEKKSKALVIVSKMVNSHVLAKLIKIIGVLAATAVISYQVVELVT